MGRIPSIVGPGMFLLANSRPQVVITAFRCHLDDCFRKDFQQNGLNFTIVFAFVCIIFDATNCFQDFVGLTTLGKLGCPITVLKIRGTQNFRLHVTSRKTLEFPISWTSGSVMQLRIDWYPSELNARYFRYRLIFSAHYCA
jgi:hypothetical protein